jgi:anti-sigma factor RsiW
MKKRKDHQDCRLLLERLSAYLDGHLPAPECRTIERHARTCSRCTEVMRELRATSGLCREAATRPLPADVRRRAQERVRRLMQERS